jgi:hypothetical protein
MAWFGKYGMKLLIFDSLFQLQRRVLHLLDGQTDNLLRLQCHRPLFFSQNCPSTLPKTHDVSLNDKTLTSTVGGTWRLSNFTQQPLQPMTTADRSLMDPLSQSEQHTPPDDVTYSGQGSLHDLVKTYLHLYRH